LCLSLAFAPTAIIGLNSDLKVFIYYWFYWLPSSLDYAHVTVYCRIDC
jgi:hypothetical protein